MSRPFTIRDLEQLQAKGKIRGFHLTETREGKKKFLKAKGKQKFWIQMNLQAWCEAKNFKLIPEYQFNKSRRFRADWFIEDLNLCLEYEGIFSEKSRHTTFEGYSRDAEKYNLMAQDGLAVLRYTAKNYKTMIDDLENYLK